MLLEGFVFAVRKIEEKLMEWIELGEGGAVVKGKSIAVGSVLLSERN